MAWLYNNERDRERERENKQAYHQTNCTGSVGKSCSSSSSIIQDKQELKEK